VTFGYGSGDLGDLPIRASGVGAQHLEGFGLVERVTLHQNACLTNSEMSKRACSELSPSPTKATSGMDARVADATSSMWISREITSWPSPVMSDVT
jgi:hypothetical protein